MSEQQSQKRGLPSEGQKMERARDGYEPIPPSNPVGGAFGERDRDTQTDQEQALRQSAKRRQDESNRNPE